MSFTNTLNWVRGEQTEGIVVVCTAPASITTSSLLPYNKL